MKRVIIALTAGLMVLVACHKDATPVSNNVSSVSVDQASAGGVIIYSNERSVTLAKDPDFWQYRKSLRYLDSVMMNKEFYAMYYGLPRPDLSLWVPNTKMTLSQFDALCKRTGFTGYQQEKSWETVYVRSWNNMKAKFPNLQDSEINKAVILTTGSDLVPFGGCLDGLHGCNKRVEIAFNSTAGGCGTGALLTSIANPPVGAAVFALCAAVAIYNDAQGHAACDDDYYKCLKDHGGLLEAWAPPFTIILLNGDIRLDLITPVGRHGKGGPL